MKRLVLALIATIIQSGSLSAASAICNSEFSCANLGCAKTCEDKWNAAGVCLGGYCPKGMIKAMQPSRMQKQIDTPKGPVELHLYNVSPELDAKIRKLLEEEK